MSVKDSFNAAAESYDQYRRKLMPCFDDFYTTAIELIPFEKSQSFEALDLGAGTGLFAGLVAGVFPKVSLTLVDFADDMLAKAEQRFSGKSPVEIISADYTEIIPSGPYDVVMSAMSIHHASDEQKAKVYKNAHAALKPGGIFINADLVLGATPETEQMYYDWWLGRVQAAGVVGEELDVVLKRISYDRCAPLDANLSWLRDAGFERVDCFYKCYNYAVMAGRKG